MHLEIIARSRYGKTSLSLGCTNHVCSWHESDMPTPLGDVRFRGKSGKHLLGVSISPFDPTETWWPRKSSKFPPAHGGENLIVDRHSGRGMSVTAYFLANSQNAPTTSNTKDKRHLNRRML